MGAIVIPFNKTEDRRRSYLGWEGAEEKNSLLNTS